MNENIGSTITSWLTYKYLDIIAMVACIFDKQNEKYYMNSVFLFLRDCI